MFAIDLIFALSIFAVLANLFLSSAGADFAQVADLVGSAATTAFRPARLRTLFAILAMGLGALLLVRASVTLGSALPAQVGLAAAGGLTIGAVAHRHRATLSARGRLPSWAGIAAGLLVEVVLIAAIFLSTTEASTRTQVVWKLPPPTNVYTHAPDPRFSIALPPGWTAVPASNTFILSGQPTGVPALAEVFAYRLRRQLPGALTAAEWRSALEAFDIRHFTYAHFQATSYPDRLRVTITPPGGPPLEGLIRGSAQGTTAWIVQVLAQRWVWPDFSNVAGAMVDSWRPNLLAHGVALAGPADASNKGATGQFGAIGLALAALLTCLLLIFKLPRGVVLTALLLTASMLLVGLIDLRNVVSLAAGHTVSGFPHLSIRGIEAAVAILIVVLALAGLRTPRVIDPDRRQAALGAFVVLAIVLLLLDLLLNVYAGAAASGPLLTVGGVTFLAGAFLWDVAFSGDLTNRDGRRMRRPARVLLYMAYMLAASAAVLYFGSAHELGPWAVRDYFFEPDQEIALSLGLVGVSYAIIVCVTRLSSNRAAGGPQADVAGLGNGGASGAGGAAEDEHSTSGSPPTANTHASPRSRSNASGLPTAT